MIEQGKATIGGRAAAVEVDWHNYQMCRTCRAPIGEPCVALSGRVQGGRPDGVRTPLPHAHARRRRRAGR